MAKARKITLIKRVTVDGDPCPDGDTCPALWRTDARSRIVVGPLVTDPQLLGQLGVADGEAAIEVPEALLEAP